MMRLLVLENISRDLILFCGIEFSGKTMKKKGKKEK